MQMKYLQKLNNMNTLKAIAVVIEFVAVQIIPFADLVIRSIRKWKKGKSIAPNEKPEKEVE